MRGGTGLLDCCGNPAERWSHPARREYGPGLVKADEAKGGWTGGPENPGPLPLLQGEYAVVAHILDGTGVHCYHSKESSPFSIRPAESWQNEMGILHLRHQWKLL